MSLKYVFKKINYQFILLLFLFCCYIIFRDFSISRWLDELPAGVNIICERLTTPDRRSIDTSTTSIRKFVPLNCFILRAKFPVCIIDAASSLKILKYFGGIRLEPLFNNENRNRFYVELKNPNHCMLYRNC